MRRFLVSAGLGFFVLVLLGLIGLAWPIDLAIAMGFGWIAFVIRGIPEVRVNVWALATVLAGLVPLMVGTRSVLVWLRGPSRWEEGAAGRLWRWSGSLMALFVLMFVAGLAAGGLLNQPVGLLAAPEPLLESDGGGASRRFQSRSNLQQISQVLHNYPERYGSFPAAAAFDRVGRPLYGWQARILPYLEEQDLFDRIDFAIPWDDPRYAQAFRTEVRRYQIPRLRDTKDAGGYALSHYAGNVHILGGAARWSMKDVTDGAATTIMAGEVVSRFKPWGDPLNWRDPALGINRSPDEFGSPFPGGANFLFVDGSVRFIKNSIDSRVLKALSTPKGGEQVSSEQY